MDRHCKPRPAALREWCATLHDATGADADAIWQWALAERVSTGLFMLRLGHQEGRTFLAVAEAVAVAAS